jgi:hypothetical protein
MRNLHPRLALPSSMAQFVEIFKYSVKWEKLTQIGASQINAKSLHR